MSAKQFFKALLKNVDSIQIKSTSKGLWLYFLKMVLKSVLVSNLCLKLDIIDMTEEEKEQKKQHGTASILGLDLYECHMFILLLLRMRTDVI